MTYFPYFLTLWHILKLWRHDVLPIPHDMLLDVMTYFLTSWHNFWHHDILFDIMTYVLTYYWTLWHNFGLYDIFWRHDGTYHVLSICIDVIHFFDIMIYFPYFVVKKYFFWTLWRTFGRHDVPFMTHFFTLGIALWTFDVMTYFVTSCHFFMLRHTLWHHAILSDIRTYFHNFWRQDVNLTANNIRIWHRQVKLYASHGWKRYEIRHALNIVYIFR